MADRHIFDLRAVFDDVAAPLKAQHKGLEAGSGGKHFVHIRFYHSAHGGLFLFFVQPFPVLLPFVLRLYDGKAVFAAERV